MKALSIPEGYQGIMPYLILNNATAFSGFMQEVFDATERFREMRDEKTIMHAELIINGHTIMFADASPEYHPQPAGLFIYADDCDERYKKAIENGAESVTEPMDQPYGRSAGVKDPFGNTWWITSLK